MNTVELIQGLAELLIAAHAASNRTSDTRANQNQRNDRVPIREASSSIPKKREPEPESQPNSDKSKVKKLSKDEMLFVVISQL